MEQAKRQRIAAPNSQPTRANDGNNNRAGFFNSAYRAFNSVIRYVNSSPVIPIVAPRRQVQARVLALPQEIMEMVIANVTMEDAANLAKTCKSAYQKVKLFQSNLKYEWVDRVFKSAMTQSAKVKNCHCLLDALSSVTGKNKRAKFDTIYEWVREAPMKCPNLPMAVFVETMLDRCGEEVTKSLFSRLIKYWMLNDASTYVAEFPIGEDSTPELIELQKRLRQFSNWMFHHTSEKRAVALMFAVLLRSLSKISDAYKLVYLLCAPRHEGQIDFEYFARSHENPVFGGLVKAFELLLESSKLRSGLSKRDIFIVLEDLTTDPVTWSMQNFVKFLMANPELYCLSTNVRFSEGFHEDAASTFYYTIRATASDTLMFQVVSGFMSSMSKTTALRFCEFVARKSMQLIQTCDPDNSARLLMLRETEVRAYNCLNHGLAQFGVRFSLRNQSV